MLHTQDRITIISNFLLAHLGHHSHALIGTVHITSLTYMFIIYSPSIIFFSILGSGSAAPHVANEHTGLGLKKDYSPM